MTKRSTPAAPSRTHSLLAETGGDIQRFREFVVFDKRAIRIEYLVCYTRIKRFCSCGDAVRERTVDEEGLNTPRPFIACANTHHDANGWSGGCGLACALPRCYCVKTKGHDFFSAKADLAKGVWVCSKQGTKGDCRFRELIEQGVDLRESEDEGDEDDAYESDFIDDEGVEDDGEEGEESDDEGEESEEESEADNTDESEDEESD